MNVADMKKVFYERYEASDKFLHYTFTGALCPLLGHAGIQDAPFLSCSLSMGVGMFARSLGGNVIKLHNADSDRHFSYTKGTPPSLFKGKGKKTALLLSQLCLYPNTGAEILYHSDIPVFLPQDAEFNLTLTKAFLKTADITLPPAETAYLAANGSHIAPYSVLAYMRSGYCTLLGEEAPKSYPLPLTGCKIITVYIKDRDRRRGDKIYTAMEAIRKRFPEAVTPARITPEHAYWAQQSLRDKTAAGYIHHLAGENMRLSAAARGLKKCDIGSLFRAMNASQRSMERYWGLKSPYTYLSRLARDTDGVMAVRCGEREIVLIAETDKVDYAVDIIKNEFEYNMGYTPVFCVSEGV